MSWPGHRWDCLLVLWLSHLALVTGGRYSDPAEVQKLVIPCIIAGVILILMLGLVAYFYYKGKGGCDCGCQCCNPLVHTKMEDCECASREGVKFSRLNSQDSMCGEACRCEQALRRLREAELQPEPITAKDSHHMGQPQPITANDSNSMGQTQPITAKDSNHMCKVCSTSDLITCHGCSQPKDVAFPRILHPADLQLPEKKPLNVDISKEVLK